jgi:hypothetical protein
MSAKSAIATDYAAPGCRPGPFGPASALIPENQRLETIPADDSTANALERLADSDFSQLPVVDIRGRVEGVFSWQSFGRRMSELHGLHIDFAGWAVRDTDLERPRFIAADSYIDTAADWKAIDYALVGDPDHVLGILTLADIWGRLNDFAESFVLIAEIEQDIRDTFRELFPGTELREVMAALSDASGEPEALAARTLDEVLRNEAIAGIDPGVAKQLQIARGQMLKLAKQRSRSRLVETLEDFSFGQYREVVFNSVHWERFRVVFCQTREIVMADFEQVNILRNDVFHFRRKIGPRDTDRLRRFRDKIRYNRSLWHRSRRINDHPAEAEDPVAFGLRRAR